MPSPFNESNMQTACRKLIPVLIMVLLATGLMTARGLVRPAPPLPAVLSSRAPRAAEQRCAECHSNITEAFRSSPHARTLIRATEESVADAFAGRTFHRDDIDVDFHYESRDGRLMVTTPAYARELSIDWLFGSGTHARTPLITWTDDDGNTSAIEHGVSWYPEGHLGVTLGMDEQTASAGIQTLGHPRSATETINCFGCHCTYVPTAGGRILFDKIEPGIGCARCHWNTRQHVHEMDSGHPSTIERFSRMTPRESVDRCGECHRRADEMGGPIEAGDQTITRFASVGLVQSACFLRQSEITLADGQPARFDCVSCHDPHRPTPRDWRFHAAVCLKCHDAAHNQAPDCPTASREDDCLSCHMPPVPANKHLKFTDHWIRIRDRKRP